MNFKKRLILMAFLTLAVLGQTTAGYTATGLENLDALQLPEWEVTSSPYGGKLLLSDSPEMVTSDGIMYQDTVSGNARLFFHHVNDTKTAKKIVVVLENKGPDKATVTVSQYGLGGPDRNWVAVGKAAQQSYMAGGDIYSIEVPAKGIAALSPVLSEAVVQPGMLVNGIYDFLADHPVNVKVMMLPVDVDVDNFSRQAKVLSADTYRLRGTFEGCNRMLIPLKVYNSAVDGSVAITLADNKLDRYVEGVDATDGSTVLNYGNYGIIYKLFLPSETSRPISYYLNPRGGDYAGFIGIKYRHAAQTPVATPTDRLAFGKPTDFATVGEFSGGESLWLTFSPPGASNLPVKLVILP